VSAPAILLTIFSLLTSPAFATAYCPVLKSPDGFVALRQGLTCFFVIAGLDPAIHAEIPH